LHHIQPDHLGTPRKVIQTSNNTAIWNWPILGNAFGEAAPTGTITLNLRFPGQYFDQETGLHYNYFRDYEAGTGRYIESDPIGLYGGPTTYGYVLGNPLGGIDPRGLEVQVCCRPAQIAGGIIDHCWIKTDTIEAGMGADPDVLPGQQYEGYGMRTQVIDHTRDKPTKCTTFNNINEQCVNDKLKIGTPLGPFLPPVNQCQNFAYGTVLGCSNGPYRLQHR